MSKVKLIGFPSTLARPSSVLVFALHILLFHSAAASTVVAISPRMAMEVGKVAFAGTVDEISFERAPRGMIVTRVLFKQVEWIMGPRGKGPVVMRLAGGTLGARRLLVPGQPTFENSKRYVLIAHKGLGTPEDLFLPIVGMHGGFFVVEPDAKSGVPSVHDWGHRPLVSASEDQLVVEGEDADSSNTQDVGPGSGPIVVIGPTKGRGQRVSEGDFVTLVRKLARSK